MFAPPCQLVASANFVVRRVRCGGIFFAGGEQVQSPPYYGVKAVADFLVLTA